MKYNMQVFEDNVNFSSDEDNPPVVDETQLENNVDLCDNSMFYFLINFSYKKFRFT